MPFKTDPDYRKTSLVKLLQAINRREADILKALQEDFGKPAFESVLTETAIVQADLKTTIKKLRRWAKPQYVFPRLVNFPSVDYIIREPYGKVLIIAPWNYPFQLAFCPLIAAVAAGNQVTLKPSELTPATSKIIAEIVSEAFLSSHVAVVQGDAQTATELLAKRWDYIFFTGSVAVGKIVAKAAAVHLTPVTLELGGKNPCIVDQSAPLALAAKRIVWGKFLNAGQTCIAPDYILVQNKVKAAFVALLKAEIEAAYGSNAEDSPDLARIINLKNFERLQKMLDGQILLYGGQTNADIRFIAPTLIDEPTLDSELMREEIFGPLLPIISYENDQELQTVIGRYEKPLSLYVFSTRNDFIKKVLKEFSFGGGTVNDTVIHFSNERLPFGGVGHSGIGAYHGKFGFETFSHRKSVIRKANWLDIPVRYAPYGNKINLIKKIMRWL
jgi:aldehyde dehydrogenase (NAD+)